MSASIAIVSVIVIFLIIGGYVLRSNLPQQPLNNHTKYRLNALKKK